jgi:hypothetical protein
MKKDRLAYLVVLALAAFSYVATAMAQLNHAYSRAEAIALAKAQGKMILTDFGRPTCEDCWGVTNAFWTTNNPPLRQLLGASCIIWEANIDTTSEYNAYTTGLDVWALPLVCFVDPNNPLTYFGPRYTGLFTATLFHNNLQKMIKANLPICVTNLPAGPLINNAFTVQGVASTNATLVGSVNGVPISRIMWRIKTTDAFQPASGTKTWSAPVSLAPGANTFESFAEYANGQKSWTNRVVLNSGYQFRLTQPVVNAGQGLQLKWFSESNATYSVLRAPSLTQPFVPLTTGRPATPPENSFTDLDQAHSSGAFYKIVKE